MPPRQLLRQLTRLSKQIHYYRSLLSGDRCLEVTYESFVANREAETRRVLGFLGIDHFLPLTSNLVKLNPESLEQIIENYDEVHAALRGTAFERFVKHAPDRAPCV